MDEIKNNIEVLENSTPEDLWISDLDHFEAEYKRQYMHVEPEHDRNRPPIYEERKTAAPPMTMPVQEYRKVSISSNTTNGTSLPQK